jgi:hypothetical protein
MRASTGLKKPPGHQLVWHRDLPPSFSVAEIKGSHTIQKQIRGMLEEIKDEARRQYWYEEVKVCSKFCSRVTVERDFEPRVGEEIL